jgi:hypothetical protein
MPITRTQAIVRLIGAWCDNVITDEDYGARVTLGDILQPDVIDAVMRDNLLAEYDLDQRLDYLVQIDRERIKT